MSGSIGAGARRSQATNAASASVPPDSAASTGTWVQPVLPAVDETPHEREQPGRRQGEPREVEARVRAAALGEPGVGERDQHDADRDVQPEDPVP